MIFCLFTQSGTIQLMHLSSSSPGGGGGGGPRAVGWGVGDLAGILKHKLAYLCPRGGGDEGLLVYYPPDHGEILGLCFG